MNTILKSAATALTIAAAAALMVSVAPQPVQAKMQKLAAKFTLTRNVDERGLNPYQVWASPVVNADDFGFFQRLPVPAVNTLVVESVSLSGPLDKGNTPIASLFCTHGETQARHSIPLTFQGSVSAGAWWTGSEPVRCYASSNSPFPLTVTIDTSTFQTKQLQWTVSVSGYLVAD